MSNRNKPVPASDETARKQTEVLADELAQVNEEEDIAGRQISSKTGKRSSAQKLAASRPEFGASPGAHPVAGAFGKDQQIGGSGEHQFLCHACGEAFDTETELIDHAAQSHQRR